MPKVINQLGQSYSSSAIPSTFWRGVAEGEAFDVSKAELEYLRAHFPVDCFPLVGGSKAKARAPKVQTSAVPEPVADRAVKSPSNPLECPDCGRVCKTAAGLRMHARTHK